MNFLTRTLVIAFALIVGSQAFAARTTTFFHGDGLGSVVAATNEAGQVLWRKDYAPFGEQIDTTPDNERISYTGKPHDDLTGLTYFGGRNFDPELGRFVSVDPVGFVQTNSMSFNRYLYVNNNPYKYVDPDGELLNFALKFVLDVAINVALNYVTTGEMNVGGALKESALGLLNPAKTATNGGKLIMAMAKVNKVAPSPAQAAKSVAPTYSRNKYDRLTDKQRKDVLKKDPDCVYCEQKKSKTVDHVTSQKEDWVKGGYKDSKAVRSARVNDPNNLSGACKSCNPSKGSRKLGTEWTPPKDR